ncbi:MAG TPA: hypothetical protein VFZ23_17835 [Pyrinomonadaceae bacterium]
MGRFSNSVVLARRLFSGVIRLPVKTLVKYTIIILGFLACLFAASNSALSQNVREGEPYIIESNSSGELSSALIDAMRSEMQGERLFVIVRLGTGETSSVLNRVRLLNTKSFIFYKGFDQQTSIFAEGERVEGEGRIEFYIGSRLRLVTLAPRNKMPNLTCCEDYFAPSKKNQKRKNRKG